MKLIDATKPRQPQPQPGDTIRGRATGTEYTAVAVKGQPGVYLYHPRYLTLDSWAERDQSYFEVIPAKTPTPAKLKQGDFVTWKVGEKETEIGVVTGDETHHGFVDVACLSHGHHQCNVHVQHLTRVAVEEIRYERL